MNTFGKIFRISIFGESHGINIGVVIDGVPAGLLIDNKDFAIDLGRRKSGAKGTTSRQEEDMPNIVSGVFNDHTTGAPVTILFSNSNVDSKDYDSTEEFPRPGHADFVASKKFKGFEDYRGGGHFSGRITLGLVVAGVIAKKIISPIKIESKILEAGGDANIEKAVEKALREKDSIGGIIQCTARNMPIGIGEPFFDSLESVLSHIIFSIPAIKGIEFGTGFAAAKMKGSEHNDCYVDINGKTRTNNAGGINGGISNGNDLVFRVVVKPTSSILQTQKTMNFKTGKMATLNIAGRHDACIALRMPVITEAATAIAIVDLLMLDKARSI